MVTARVFFHHHPVVCSAILSAKHTKIKQFLLSFKLVGLVGTVADEQGGKARYHSRRQTNLKEESV
jgi:hypothetical protein